MDPAKKMRRENEELRKQLKQQGEEAEQRLKQQLKQQREEAEQQLKQQLKQQREEAEQQLKQQREEAEQQLKQQREEAERKVKELEVALRGLEVKQQEHLPGTYHLFSLHHQCLVVQLSKFARIAKAGPARDIDARRGVCLPAELPGQARCSRQSDRLYPFLLE
jgi:hypothetical protein